MTIKDVEAAMRLIERTNDPAQLRQIAANARLKGRRDVARAADLRLYDVSPAEQPGTLEHDVWRAIFALEGSLPHERGKTIRLTRTRQKIARVGMTRTVTDLVTSVKPSEGFTMLADRGMLDSSFEAIALRHPDAFDDTVRAAASQRLHSA